MRRLFALLLLLFALPAQAEDAQLRASLDRFFAGGALWQGARAELMAVGQWPQWSGEANWQLPDLRNHPERFALIAEQPSAAGMRRAYVPVQVRWWAEVAVARHDLPAGALLLPEMVAIERVDIAGHVGQVYEKTEFLLGKRLTRPLAAHGTFDAAHLRVEPLIRRGDPVTMLVAVGALKVRAEGSAMREADLGDTIPVRNLRSNEVLRGVVTGRNEVRIAMGGVQ